MLKKFSVRNYKGFKDTIAIDFSKFKDYQFNKHVINKNILSKGVIYGKNGTGKTNLGLALFDITLHLIDKQQSLYEFTNYLNAGSIESHATFEYVFEFGDTTIIYRYHKVDAKHLVFEELVINDQKVYSYNYNAKRGDFENMDLVNANTLQTNNKDINISLLRYIKNNTIQTEKSILSQLFNFVEHMLWFRSLNENEYIGYKSGVDFLLSTITKNGLLNDYENFLNEADINLKLTTRKDVTGAEVIYAQFPDNKLVNFWEIASNGTKALTLYYYWSHRFSDISFLFIDEFDAFYHTELSELILKKLTESKAVQALVTTHNTALMTNNILRPDCYFILTKNKLTPLTDCTERELREGHNLEKMYRNGEFKL